MKPSSSLLFSGLIFWLLLILAACSAAPVLPTPSGGQASPSGFFSTSKPGQPLATTATLSEVSGLVEIKNPGESEFRQASNGDILQVQGQVRTGADGRARLNLSTGTIIRVAPDSVFTFAVNEPLEAGLLTRLKMQAGQVWIILNGGRAEVETPSGTASVRGSYMSIWIDPELGDVWVTCLEGWCKAENPTAVLEMVAGQGCTLYSFDPESNIPPPPPQLRYLTQTDIEQFLAHNPEAQQVMQAMAATATALPPLPPVPTPIPPASCFDLGLPVNGESVVATNYIQFDWNDQPDAHTYLLVVTTPNGSQKAWRAWRSSYQLDVREVPTAGTYRWHVIAFNSSMQPICSSGPWTFSKAESTTPDEGCFQLISPAQNAVLPETGLITFSWQACPNCVKYILTIIQPNGSEINKVLWTTSYTLDSSSLPFGGTYTWYVTAYDSNSNPVCCSGDRTFTKPGTPVPTHEPSTCVSLLSPANGASLPGMGAVEFTWSAHPQAARYLINFVSPNGFLTTIPEISTTHTRYMESLPMAGQHTWWVTVLDSSLREICSSQHFTFTKPQTKPTAGPTKPGNVNAFWGQIGPSGAQASCASLNFQVSTSLSGSIRLIYSYSNPNPTGYDSPHEVMGHGPGTAFINLTCFEADDPDIVYYRFAVYQNGQYIHDPMIYSFSCP
ncbi:MAG: FecR family protein [Anaerolineales bacterium]|nr:FecR family protein [Anaerolineales bacterium]MCX7608445.1 FecR family protein [Anaerolineales bacterium]MDW8228185.1 FecR family protein [Anaerolineales bacterium]